MMKDGQKQEAFDRVFQSVRRVGRIGGQPIDASLIRAQNQGETLKPPVDPESWLRSKQSCMDPRPGFVAASQKRLLARIRAENGARKTTAPRWMSPDWVNQRYTVGEFVLRASLLALVVGFLLLNAARSVQASATGLPGDFFYPLKIALERTRLATSFSATGDAQLHIQYARLRLMEVQALTFEGRYEAIPGVVDDFEWHVHKALLSIDRVSIRDRETAHALADSLQQTLTAQGDLLRLMVGFAPLQARSQFDHVRLISENSASELREIFAPNGGDARLGLAFTGLPSPRISVDLEGFVAYAPSRLTYILDRRVAWA